MPLSTALHFNFREYHQGPLASLCWLSDTGVTYQPLSPLVQFLTMALPEVLAVKWGLMRLIDPVCSVMSALPDAA
jgi:hypothetical protein